MRTHEEIGENHYYSVNKRGGRSKEVGFVILNE